MSFLDKIFGDPNVRIIKKKLWPKVEKINALEKELAAKSDAELAGYTLKFREQLKTGKTIDDFLPEAFAVAREAAKRTIGQRHYDVQLIGAMVLHEYGIAEMKTGEGKTLTATLAVYLNALSGEGAHVVTVNDYLARRDTVWMGKIYNFLGLSVGCIQHDKSYLYDSNIIAGDSPSARGGDTGGVGEEGEDTAKAVGVIVDYDHLRPVSRQEAYAADITYGTNNEFGFDYLRDNMAGSTEQLAQRELNYAIVDEVDSILIDEARTPLIISAPDTRPTDMYVKYSQLVKRLEENSDYNIDEKMRSSTLTEAGIKKLEGWLNVKNIYTEGGLEMAHHIEQALKANTLFKLDREYVVREGEIIIVDEFTGRLMPGRRYSEGLHQAIEAKEGVEIKRETRTLATITLQNYFRLYRKLAGMTGTAATEAEEFRKIYNLEVFPIPTNKPMVRRDNSDRVYKNKKGKYQAVVAEIKERNAQGQPLLVGTISIEQNEELSYLLNKAGVRHEIINAKNHEREAEIIAQAGRAGAITLATNMAGRGVDIILGGNPSGAEEAANVKRLGGLHVLGTERHEARRIDNQLRGRSGRQGDMGSSQFFVSLEDDLMRIFASDKIKGLMTRLGVPDDMPIENKLVSRSIESAQKKVESHNFDIRKHLVEYDDVINRHREAIYRRRREILALTPPPASLSADLSSEASVKEESLAEGGGREGVGEEAEGRPQSEEGGRRAGEQQEYHESRKTARAIIFEYLEQEIMQVVNFHTAGANFADWNLSEIEQTMKSILPLPSREGGGGGLENELNLTEIIKQENERDKGQDALLRSRMIEHLFSVAKVHYEKLMQAVGDEPEQKRLETAVLLNSIDTLWMDHLETIDNLRASIGLRGYGQRDPLVEYKREAYKLFQELQAAIQNEVVYTIFKVALARSIAQTSIMQKMLSSLGGLRFSAPAKTMGQKSEIAPAGEEGAAVEIVFGNRYEGKKVGRNDPCPCGNERKFKKCGMLNTAEHQQLMAKRG